ncbi:hypothetical protein SAMN04244553_2364 [Nocardia amikacinitolerans]|uniref:Uncharacterized protein n=1 Tax=Nocardia amikacinitolerans TaxID=756689 RepID=A0A285L7B7_9NOCA|nr:hypothetical protein [Nocardia amikacinitolerans]MCP2275005.1 hypothetical protein [Nocardia amikacinitolerans]MCP2296252.1 hypothetical protein [Nocardia amikacinitolerans]MCP2316311.1 hypothetical protein [Nocardia amikacinitolerans]SNY80792.1 hypothetical protein SAMN04244553_2364 [Nocardia amikacinitolerans]
MCLTAPLLALTATAAIAGTASADSSGCQGSMNGPWGYNGVCQGGEGTYRLEIDCVGYNFTTFPPILGQYTTRADLPVGQPGTVACFGPNWSSAGWALGSRIFRL